MSEITQNLVYPWRIFQEAWALFTQQWKKFSVLYLIFGLPVALLKLYSDALPKENILAVVAIFILGIIISSWGSVANLISADKTTNNESWEIGKSILASRVYALKFIVLIVSFYALVLFLTFGCGIVFYAGWMGFFKGHSLGLAAIIVSTLVLVAALVYGAVRWSLSGVVCVLEQSWPLAALRGSNNLIKPHVSAMLKIYLLIIVTVIIYSLPVFIFKIIFNAQAQNATLFVRLANVYDILIQSVFIPFVTLAMVLLYKKLKGMAIS